MSENKNKKWDVEDVIYLIQFVLFYITVVGGIVLIVLAAIKKISFPLLGVILIYAVAVIIQVAFLIIFTKPMPDEKYLKAPQSNILEDQESSIDEEMQKEIDEIRELKARLKKESERKSALTHDNYGL